MINVMVVFGTRPEAIKVVPVIKELEARKETNPIVCVTAQHREMLDQILQEFDIQADYDLNIMQQGQTLAEITTKALVGLEKIIKEVKPDIVLVHGDTTTTFAGALAAFYNGTTIGHLEAGLRTYNKFSPYPEEMNRQMVSVLADIHFAPTHKSKQNLLREAKKKNIYVTGNTAIDALKLTVNDFNGLYQERGGKVYVDLKAINARQLEEAGVKNIDICPYCTVCDNDMFFSYRKENATTNRHSAVVRLLEK